MRADADASPLTRGALDGTAAFAIDAETGEHTRAGIPALHGPWP